MTVAVVWSRLLDMISPRRCAVCGGRLGPTERGLCAACCLRLPRTGYAHEPYGNRMAQLFWGRMAVERSAALFYYEAHSETSRVIYAMKYWGRPDLAVAMGRMAAAEMLGSGFFDGIDLIVPVPLTRRRQRERGYNQCWHIARGIASVTGIPVSSGSVVRTKGKDSQTGLDRRRRLDNVEGAFSLRDAGCLRGRHVLIVDDVVTTGATVIACATAMRAAGGVRLSVMTLGFAGR